MAKIEQFSRLINHRLSTSGQTFTIPVSNDHTDETWLATDLYIGEIGINVTDDKAYFRSNNGIVQLATGTSSSGSTSSVAQVFVFNSPNIQIGTTYSADAIIPRSGYYTDLGSTTLAFKDLFLGGSSTNLATIEVNGGLYLKESSDGIMITNGAASGNAPIEIHTNSSNANKDRPLFLNTRYGLVSGSSNYITSASVNGFNTTNNAYVFAAAGTNIGFDSGLSYVSHLGRGFSRNVYEDDMHVVGGKLAVKGMADDGTGQYAQSEWITTQSLLRTSNALTTDIVNIPWYDAGTIANIIQLKGYLIGTVIDDPTKVYHAEILGCYTVNDDGLTVTEVGSPILNASSAGWTGAQPDVEMSADASGLYVSVTGVGTLTIQWLCSYSYHRLIAIQ
jgi:hypothetical protein